MNRADVAQLVERRIRNA